MDDLAELALEGATVGATHYDKVTDPLKDQVKRLPNPVRKLRGQQGQNQGQDWNHSDMDGDDNDYNRPRRSNTDRDRWGSRRDRDVEVEDDEDYNSRRRSSTIQRSPRRDRRRGGEGYIEETYERRSGRAKSIGRDGYDRGGGHGLRRDDRRRSTSFHVCSMQR